MLLELSNIQAAYGSSQVLFGVDLFVRPREVVSLLGRNGMGKTTTIRTIMGLMPAKAGSMRFSGQETARLTAVGISRMGIAIVPEGRQVFPTLTVRENLIATASNRRNVANPWTLARVEQLFPVLKDRARVFADRLSGGEQQMLAIGRALLTNPKLIILDEATEGLAPLIRQEVWKSLHILRENDLSILVVDKNISEFKDLVDRHYVMTKGKIAWCGSGAELDRDSAVVSSHLHF